MSQAREAAREAGFNVVEHGRSLDALRCRWDGNDRKKLEQRLEKLSSSPVVRLIEPDPSEDYTGRRTDCQSVRMTSPVQSSKPQSHSQTKKATCCLEALG